MAEAVCHTCLSNYLPRLPDSHLCKRTPTYSFLEDHSYQLLVITFVFSFYACICILTLVQEVLYLP